MILIRKRLPRNMLLCTPLSRLLKWITPRGVHQEILFILILLLTILFWNEFAIYYVTLGFGCAWPPSPQQPSSSSSNQLKQVNALVLADTHLLGTLRGHWFDKLRREWQMRRSFQTALQLFKPDTVFVLGDLFDEGDVASEKDFNRYVNRFYELFALSEGTKMYVVAGNHDIGFHFWVRKSLNDRFARAMNTSTVDHLVVGDVHFVRVNSIAMDGDGCALCSEANRKLDDLSRELEQLGASTGRPVRPILLTHFPMYRSSEALCTEPDAVPLEEKNTLHRIGIDSLTPEASDYLMARLKPRLILNGHVHHSCVRVHRGLPWLDALEEGVPEWTVASFNWRNKVNPSFLLLRANRASHSIAKCFLPNENTVWSLYGLGGGLVFAWLMLILYRVFILLRRRRRSESGGSNGGFFPAKLD